MKLPLILIKYCRMSTILSTEYKLLRIRPKRCLVPWGYPGEPHLWPEPMEAGLSLGQHLPRIPQGPTNAQDHLAAFLGARLHSPPHLRVQPAKKDYHSRIEIPDYGLPQVHYWTWSYG